MVAVRPTVVVTLGYDLPRNPGQLGVRGAILETLALAGASLRLVSALDGTPLDEAFYAGVDGLVLPGGPDPHPSRWGEPVHPSTNIDEARDGLEYTILAGCLERGIPVLGVCRGLQLANVALGGSLVQDLPSGPVDHRGSADRTVLAHRLRLLDGSRMSTMSGGTELPANTAHHQAIDRLGDHLVASAWAEDDCIEAVEWDTDDQWLVAVQYHPEDLHPAEPAHLRLFTTFLEQARTYRSACRELDERTPCTT
jgi:putative glutamine amidotransferase